MQLSLQRWKRKMNPLQQGEYEAFPELVACIQSSSASLKMISFQTSVQDLSMLVIPLLRAGNVTPANLIHDKNIPQRFNCIRETYPLLCSKSKTHLVQQFMRYNTCRIVRSAVVMCVRTGIPLVRRNWPTCFSFLQVIKDMSRNINSTKNMVDVMGHILIKRYIALLYYNYYIILSK